jgi:hypothetical protein
MPRIEYTAVDFLPSAAKVKNGTGRDDFAWSDLIWAAITVGRGGWFDVLRFGNPSKYEVIFRACLLKSAIQASWTASSFECTKAYRNLDPSEKGAVSYFIGLTMCKLFAERFLDVPWLLHLDVYRSQLSPVLLHGRSRPDLVGQSVRGDWVVFESKGRTSVPTQIDKSKAKVQSCRLTHVSGKQVACGVALFSYFCRDELKVFWQDPNQDDESEEPQEPFRIEVQPGDFGRRYYRPILDFIGTDRLLRHAEDQRPLRFEEADFSLAIEPKLLTYLIAEDYAAAFLFLRETWYTASPPEGISELVFKKDGIAVVAGDSWNEDQVQRELF